MSNRTAGASRAIREAWYNEQRLVLEGKGTRDWTGEQQRSIAERGKAYDDRGLAFEGQHMKSVSAYPDYQDDRRNIQFLTKEEHLAAHGGNWQTQTNGYYDPVSKTMSDFGDGPPRPCAEAPLTKPLFIEPPDEASTQKTSTKGNNGATTEYPAAASRGSSRQLAESLKRVAKQASSNPQVLEAVGAVAGIAVAGIAAAVFGSRARAVGDCFSDGSPKGDLTTGPSTQPSTRQTSAPSTDSSRGTRRSPDEHGVSGYTKKDGTSVRPYRRGGNSG